jgi:hypothetical protein
MARHTWLNPLPREGTGCGAMDRIEDPSGCCLPPAGPRLNTGLPLPYWLLRTWILRALSAQAPPGRQSSPQRTSARARLGR